MTAGADLRLLRAAVFTAVCVTLSAAGHTLAGGPRMPLWALGTGCALVFAVAAPLAGRERSLPGIAALLAAGQVALHTLFSCGGPAGGGAMAMGAGGASGAGGGAGSAGGRDAVRRLAGQLLCGDHTAQGLSDAEARHVVSHAGLSVRHVAAGAAQTGHTGGGAHGMGYASAGGLLHAPLCCLREATHAALSMLDGPMLAGHALAALVLGWLLRRGEAALWRLVRLSARSVRRAPQAAAWLVPIRALRAALAYVTALSAGLLPNAPARACLTGAREKLAPRFVLLHHSVHRRGPPRLTGLLAHAA